MGTPSATLTAPLAFTLPSDVSADDERQGVLRARSFPPGDRGRHSFDVQPCEIHDCNQLGDPPLDLLGAGFDVADLAGFDDLQTVLARVEAAAHITEDDAAAIRSALDGVRLSLAGGLEIDVSYIAPEGLIMRKSGPNGLKVTGDRMTGMNDHDAATSIHADQDVFGTPLAQLMEGRAPDLFRHESPDGRNDDADMLLLNLWIPLRQITRPLVLADQRSIDRPRHQLRYGLATESFLERSEDQVVNDIWTFLHDPDQQWYFHSEMDHRSAYVFNTLGTPHGAVVLPGEDVAAELVGLVGEISKALRAGQTDDVWTLAARSERIGQAEETTPALERAIADLRRLASEAGSDPAALRGDRAESWLDAANRVAARLTRCSLEMRIVASIVA